MTNTDNKEVFSENLRKYIDRKGVTQRELAEVIGVSTSALNDWICAKKYPRIDKIERLAEYFGIKKSDLIEDHAVDYTIKNSDLEHLIEIARLLSEDKLKMLIEIARAFHEKGHHQSDVLFPRSNIVTK